MLETTRGTRGARLALCLAFGASVASACGVTASHTPLGGTYDAPELGTNRASDRRAPATTTTTTTPATAVDSDTASDSAPEPVKPPPAPVVADDKLGGDTLIYQPLKAGDRIEAEVAIAFESEPSGSAPRTLANSALRVSAKLRVELNIRKASALSLDELELTVTTLAMHTELAGQAVDAKPEPPEVYDVTLGQSPNIRARSGSKPDAGDRAILLMLVAPIADFHAHWAQAPTLALKPGWSSKVPVTLPAFADGHAETVKVGPFGVAYAGRAADRVHFDVTLPIHYGADMGGIDFDLSGHTSLSADSARPTSFDLNGPFTAQPSEPGRSHPAPAIPGRTKFSATLRYR